MKKLALLSAACCLAFFSVRGQGCSDAGACTLGPMKTILAEDSARVNSFVSGISVGLGEEKVVHISPYAELNVRFLPGTFLHLRAPFQINRGGLAGTYDLADFYIGLSQQVALSENSMLEVLLAAKLPQNRADKKSDNKDPQEQLPLPMPYQTSLGTYDMIAGISLRAGGLHLAVGHQQVLRNRNENAYVQRIWLEDAEGTKYFNSRNLIRANDAFARLEYTLSLLDRLELTGGVLPIYHLSEDSYEDLEGIRRKIEGSDGLTLNITASAMYRLTDHSGLRATAAAPAITRDARPDGLTRFAVAALNYEFRF